MTISITGSTAYIWAYKTWTIWSNWVNTVNALTGTFTSSDVWRLIAIVPNPSNTVETQVRLIIAFNSSTQVTVHDNWTNDIIHTSGVEWRMAHNAQDVADLSNPLFISSWRNSHIWDWEWSIEWDGFFWDINIDLAMIWKASVLCPIANTWIVQFWVLWWWENNNSTEVSYWCSISIHNSLNSTRSIYTSSWTPSNNWFIVNYYNSLIRTSNLSVWRWMFQRWIWPTRLIGTKYDWPMWGRLYSQNTEWVNCSMQWNNSPTVPFSLWNTYIRDISWVTLLQSDYGIKTYLSFSWVLRDTIFKPSVNTIVSNLWSWGRIDFVDCTTFDNTKVSWNSSTQLVQLKSVNYKTVDVLDIPVENVKVSLTDKDNTIAESWIVVSNSLWIVSETQALFWRRTSIVTEYAPFTIRVRKYGFEFIQITTSLTDKIVSSLQQIDNIELILSEVNAWLVTWITIDWVLKTITVTWLVTASELYDYSQWWATQDVNMTYNEPIFSSWWNLSLKVWWKLILNTNINWWINISWNVELSSIIDLDNHNISWILTFTLAWTYNIINSIISEVINTSPWSVILNVSGSTSITTNTWPNINIVSSATLTVSINQTWCDVVILEAGTDIVITSVDSQAWTDFIYTYSTLQDVDIWVIKQWYVVNYIYWYTLSATDASLPITLLTDRNYG